MEKKKKKKRKTFFSTEKEEASWTVAITAIEFVSSIVWVSYCCRFH